MNSYVATKIDGKHLNARYFAGMKKEDAVKEMIASKETTDPKWAESAYDKMVADVAKMDATPEPTETKPKKKSGA